MTVIMPLIRYSDDAAVNVAANRLAYCFAPNPWDRGRNHGDKTIANIHASLRDWFGDYANNIKITVH